MLLIYWEFGLVWFNCKALGRKTVGLGCSLFEYISLVTHYHKSFYFPYLANDHSISGDLNGSKDRGLERERTLDRLKRKRKKRLLKAGRRFFLPPFSSNNPNLILYFFLPFSFWVVGFFCLHRLSILCYCWKPKMSMLCRQTLASCWHLWFVSSSSSMQHDVHSSLTNHCRLAFKNSLTLLKADYVEQSDSIT